MWIVKWSITSGIRCGFFFGLRGVVMVGVFWVMLYLEVLILLVIW